MEEIYIKALHWIEQTEECAETFNLALETYFEHICEEYDLEDYNKLGELIHPKFWTNALLPCAMDFYLSNTYPTYNKKGKQIAWSPMQEFIRQNKPTKRQQKILEAIQYSYMSLYTVIEVTDDVIVAKNLLEKDKPVKVKSINMNKEWEIGKTFGLKLYQHPDDTNILRPCMGGMYIDKREVHTVVKNMQTMIETFQAMQTMMPEMMAELNSMPKKLREHIVKLQWGSSIVSDVLDYLLDDSPGSMINADGHSYNPRSIKFALKKGDADRVLQLIEAQTDVENLDESAKTIARRHIVKCIYDPDTATKTYDLSGHALRQAIFNEMHPKEFVFEYGFTDKQGREYVRLAEIDLRSRSVKIKVNSQERGNIMEERFSKLLKVEMGTAEWREER